MTRKVPGIRHPAQQIDASRRRFLGQAGLGVLGAGVLGSGLAFGSDGRVINSSARIVIVGAGAAGLALANRLDRALDGARITIIDRRERHIYQPGLTLVATGVWPTAQVLDENARYMPRNIEWLKANVAEFDPDANCVFTDGGERVDYDFLLIATGLHLDFAAIEGMDTGLIGREGIGCVYDSPEHATRTWAMIDEFTTQGGVGLFTRGPGGIKCAGAPLKVTMLTEDLLQRRGRRNDAELVYNPPGKGLFSQPDINEFLKSHFPERGIGLNWNHRLTGIEPEARRATFATPEGDVRLDYDFIHVVPPMRAPDPLFNSPLAWQEGPFADDGRWLEVDKYTLRHPRYPNVFGAGDCVGTPIGKTAASVKAQVPVAAHNLLRVLEGREEDARYNGYTSCPLVTGRGSAMLVEFDYELKMVPSFPVIDPMREQWLPWVMKDRLLQGAYNAMLRGRV